MKNFKSKDFEEVLNTIENQVSSMVECDVVRSIGGNFNTRGMSYKSKDHPQSVGTIIVGEDKGTIAVDISLLDGAVRSFMLEDEHDSEGIGNITSWFRDSYS
ncbi:MAG TPA: hypothetical protein VEF53_03275 [Patescibacteria group bacterium]|nr:hypothetical protein [Patescibacteria group bacterium]